MHGVDAKLIKVKAAPPQHHLKDAMQFLQRHGGRHQDTPPDHRAQIEQADLQLQDRAAGSTR